MSRSRLLPPRSRWTHSESCRVIVRSVPTLAIVALSYRASEIALLHRTSQVMRLHRVENVWNPVLNSLLSTSRKKPLNLFGWETRMINENPLNFWSLNLFISATNTPMSRLTYNKCTNEWHAHSIHRVALNYHWGSSELLCLLLYTLKYARHARVPSRKNLVARFLRSNRSTTDRAKTDNLCAKNVMR